MNDKKLRPKLCYILLKYAKDTDRHYYHLYSFIDRLAKSLDIRLIIVQSEGKPDFDNVTDIITNDPGNTKRTWLFQQIWTAHRDGFRFFYCHYTFGAAVFASLLTRLLGGKTFFWHCIMLDVLLKEHNVSLQSKGFYIFKFGSRIIQTFVTGSEFMRLHYHRLFKIPLHRIAVIPNYIELERFNPDKNDGDQCRKHLNLPENKHVVLFVHGLEKGKGGSQLVPLAQHVVKTHSNVLFIVVGDGSEKPMIEQQIEYAGLGEFFRMVGRVPNSDIPAYYRASDIFIMPSLYEEFSRTLLEAMASGTPFVASDGRGGTFAYTSKIQHEFVVTGNDMQRFAKKLILLLDNPKLRAEMVKEGLRHVQNYSQENIEQLLLDVLNIKD